MNNIKKKYKIIVISVIILFLIIVFVVVGYSFMMKDYRKLLSTGWTKDREKYESTKEIEFPGDPIPNTLIMFFDGRVKICNYEDSDEEDSTDDKIIDDEPIDEEEYDSECIEYDYHWKKGKITIYSHPENVFGVVEIVYNYIFNEDDELVLTYSGDGFEYRFYYTKAMG